MLDDDADDALRPIRLRHQWNYHLLLLITAILLPDAHFHSNCFILLFHFIRHSFNAPATQSTPATVLPPHCHLWIFHLTKVRRSCLNWYYENPCTLLSLSAGPCSRASRRSMRKENVVANVKCRRQTAACGLIGALETRVTDNSNVCFSLVINFMRSYASAINSYHHHSSDYLWIFPLLVAYLRSVEGVTLIRSTVAGYFFLFLLGPPLGRPIAISNSSQKQDDVHH